MASLSVSSSSDDATSLDSSSSDECNIYTNAALKLNALNNQKKSNTRNRIHQNDVNTNESERPDSPGITLLEPVVDDRPVEIAQEPVQIENDCEKDPVVCIDDAECVLVNDSTPERATGNSRKRNATVPDTLLYSRGMMNDSIEDELNKTYDDSFHMSQEDNDNCVMIGSPELKKSNSDNTEVTIKVLWKSDECQRFELGKYETFQKVFKSLANSEGISEDQVLITKKERRITPFDTPASIDWSILDILDGGVVSAELAKKHKGHPGQHDDVSENGCKIKIQTSDKRSLTLTLKHDESFSTLLKACSEQLDIPQSKIKFYFDGELIEMDETPDMLDLEDEACIDCKISK